MSAGYLGESYALLAALTWGVALVLFKRAGERVPPLALNLFKNVIALVLLAATLCVIPEGGSIVGRFSHTDIAILVASGMMGIALADTLFFHSLNLIGVGLVSIVDCLYSPLVIFFSFILLSEQITSAHFVGTGLILTGVLISSRHAPPANRTHAQVVSGILLGVVSMALMTFGIVMAKPVLEIHDFPLIWAATLRLLPATLALVLIVCASPNKEERWAAFRPSQTWWLSVPASFLGAYLAMIFWVAGFKYAKGATAGILNQTSIIFALILATVILKEPFTRRKLIAVGLALAGVVIVMLNVS